MNRALALSAIATQVWAAPILSEEIIDQYRPRPAAARSSYTIDDYPNLSPTSSSYSKEVRELFDTLQKAILAIDPVVTVDYLKLYIAFKAETNFVDVVPQLRRLRLTLNMRFAEIIDPRGLCKDVTNLGRWGNGDVEIGFSSLEDFPYVLGLIRQSFDYQMNGST
jgi:predicted transport protein